MEFLTIQNSCSPKAGYKPALRNRQSIEPLPESPLLRFVAQRYTASMQTSHEGTERRLEERMAALGIREADLRETFVRSAGHGGQNVNKTSTCLVLVHPPTGILIRCQTTRHQGQNRQLARELMPDKLEARQKARAEAARSQIEKLRRQNRGRSKCAKERILADKNRHSAKKAMRRQLSSD